MSFTESIAACMSKYAMFSGRASRSEYWWFYLFTVLLGWFASMVGAVVLGPMLGSFFSLAVSIALMIPALAVFTRRLHDTGRSGWWWLLSLTIIGIIPLIIWLAAVGNPAPNQYGEVPAK